MLVFSPSKIENKAEHLLNLSPVICPESRKGLFTCKHLPVIASDQNPIILDSKEGDK